MQGSLEIDSFTIRQSVIPFDAKDTLNSPKNRSAHFFFSERGASKFHSAEIRRRCGKATLIPYRER